MTPTDWPMSTPAESSRFSQTLRALGSRNFRLFFAGQTVSLIGTWIQSIAMSWLVYRLTGSAFMLGIVGFMSQFPVLVITPFAGVAADRWNRHHMVIVTQAGQMLQAMALAALTLTGTVRVWQILALSAFVGIVNGFDIPGRQSFLVEMVESKDDLANAIALNSSMFNGARLVGPAIAGALIAVVGEGWCFFINGVSFLAVLGALLAMRVPPRQHTHTDARLIAQLREGFTYAFGFPPIRAVLLLLALVSLIAQPYAVLMPVVATRVLHGGADTLGFLMAATGLGALTGALYLAGRASVVGLGRVIVVAAVLFAAGLFGLALSHETWLSCAFLVLAGFGMMVHAASSNTILQTITDEHMRGRVISIYTVAFLGTAPLGSLYAGSLAGCAGAPITIAIGGAVTLVGAFFFARALPIMREHAWPIYRRMGILPEVAAALGHASELSAPPEQQ